jgi:hypothetical protein
MHFRPHFINGVNERHLPVRVLSRIRITVSSPRSVLFSVAIWSTYRESSTISTRMRTLTMVMYVRDYSS